MTQMESFTPQYTSPEEPQPEAENSDKPKEFELPEFISETDSGAPSFSFDNEIQRNFDPTNVKKAKEGVQEIFKDAMDRIKVQAEQIKSQAHGEGFAAGQKQGFEEGELFAKQEFTPFLETLEKLVEELSQFRKAMFPKVEREMISMVVQLAKKVIHTELTLREDSIQDVIRLAVQSVLDREKMVIKVNPGDQIHAETYRPELHHLFSEIKNITIEGQSSIERGGCIIETNFGTVDAQLHNLQDQIDRILSIAPPPVEEETVSTRTRVVDPREPVDFGDTDDEENGETDDQQESE